MNSHVLTGVSVALFLVGCDDEDAPTPAEIDAWPPADMHSSAERAMATYFQAMERQDGNTAVGITSPKVLEKMGEVLGGRDKAQETLRTSIEKMPAGMIVRWKKLADWQIQGHEAFATIELRLVVPGREPDVQEKRFGCEEIDGKWYCGKQW